MIRNKIIFALISLSVMLVTLLLQPPLSYYYTYETSGGSSSTVTSGDIKVKIIERLGDGESADAGFSVMPGATIAKKISVQNVGGHPFWLRVKLVNTVDDSTISPEVFELSINTKDWIAGEDGFYYYYEALMPGAESQRLLEQIKISGSADNQYIGKTVHLGIRAYAVQSENNNAESPLDVVGWPAEG